MILADHCVFEATVRLLEAAGYAVTRLREIAPTNSADSDVLALAVERDEVLLTNDLDFGDIVRYPPSDYCGVILLRIRPATEDKVHALLLRVLAEFGRARLRAGLLVIDRNKYRFRVVAPRIDADPY